MKCRRLLVRIQSDAERFSLSNKCSINHQHESCSITYLYTIFILNLFILNILITKNLSYKLCSADSRSGPIVHRLGYHPARSICWCCSQSAGRTPVATYIRPHSSYEMGPWGRRVGTWWGRGDVPILVRLGPGEVMRTINSMDSSKTSGSDNVLTILVKMAAADIAEPLSKLLNKSVKEGIYPTQCKRAAVKPVFKGKGFCPNCARNPVLTL